MKYYKIICDEKDAFIELKDRDDYFKWVKCPSIFLNELNSKYDLYFTMYGLNKFIDNDFQLMKSRYNNIDINTTYIDVKDPKIIHSNNHLIIYKRR